MTSSSSVLATDAYTVQSFEVAAIILIFLYLLVLFLGAYRNQKLSKQITTHLTSRLQLEFARISPLEKDGFSTFYYHATGRRNATSLTAIYHLAPRMDLFSYASPQLFVDRIVIYLPIPPDVRMPPVTLLLARRQEMPRLRAAHAGDDMKHVELCAASVVEVAEAPNMIAMSEHAHIVSELLTPRAKALLGNLQKYMTFTHVTERGMSWEPQCRMSRRLIRVECMLPSKRSAVEGVLKELAEFSMLLLDATAGATLSLAARKKCAEVRADIVKAEEKRVQKIRAEELSRVRAEKRKEEEKNVGNLSREKQIKYEEKKRKKEIADRMKKGKAIRM